MVVSHFVRSHETGITTPTVKARFNRLINIGFIKSVSPIFDFNMVQESIWRSELRKGNNTDSKAIKNEDEVKIRNQYGN